MRIVHRYFFCDIDRPCALRRTPLPVVRQSVGNKIACACTHTTPFSQSIIIMTKRFHAVDVVEVLKEH
jgi:hypothetical protein